MAPVAELALDPPEIWPTGAPRPASPPRLSLAAVTPSPDQDTIIARPRLLEQFERAGRVTVVSAPAGSGKTSLLRSWIREAGLDSTAAWLPLGHAERDPQRFWASVVDAVRRTEPGSALVSEAMAVQDLDGWTCVEGLMDHLATLEDRLWLMIDDLDELDATATLRQLELLLAHAPEKLRFALSTRRDLPLGLHRIRLEGELTELRGADLRFSPCEARELFDAVEVPISESALEVLVDRTEGWAAGLRLAAISLAQHPDPERFVTEFSDSKRAIQHTCKPSTNSWCESRVEASRRPVATLRTVRHAARRTRDSARCAHWRQSGDTTDPPHLQPGTPRRPPTVRSTARQLSSSRG